MNNTPGSEKDFSAALCNYLNILSMSDVDACDLFHVSLATLRGWKHGDILPYHLVRGPILCALAGLAQYRFIGVLMNPARHAPTCASVQSYLAGAPRPACTCVQA